MDYHRRPYFVVALFFTCLLVVACGGSGSNDGKLVSSPAAMDKSVSAFIKSALQNDVKDSAKAGDSTKLLFAEAVNAFYSSTDFAPVWSTKEKWTPLGDSLLSYIANAEQDGLFSKDYHGVQLDTIKNILQRDSVKRMDPSLWGQAELMLTDGLMHIMKDLRYGRLQHDSINKDTSLQKLLIARTKELAETKHFTAALNALQPKFKAYWELKKGIKSFIDSMDKRVYTYVSYPYKDSSDSLRFIKVLQKRLNESGMIDMTPKRPDSATLKAAISRYQKQKGLPVDGKVNSAFVRNLNTSDVERFKRIAITLDRYKQVPDKMPDRYIWVNLPSYHLQVWDHDSLVLTSKTIVGKPATRTPILSSYITNMVTYPTWTVPSSITKGYLSKLRSNPNYLARLGLKLINRKGQVVNGSDVDWSKYSKGIPFSVMQNSGDNNALGVFKFNFDNEYAVYLHDTNQRYLFKNGSRALSHGCVRVQEWDKLAYYIAGVDSVNYRPKDSLPYTSDSLRSWVSAKKHRQVPVKSKIGVFLRYFSCEGKDGKVIFYDDIYGEDKVLREKYFAGK